MFSPRSVIMMASSPARIGFAIVHKARFTLDVLFINQNRIIEKGLFCLLPMDPVHLNLA